MSEVGYTRADLLLLSGLGLEVGPSFALSVSVGMCGSAMFPYRKHYAGSRRGFAR
jgi:hypothetical protein